MLICGTCGIALTDKPLDTAPDCGDHAELLGRSFYGLPREAVLCNRCTEEVRLTGEVVVDVESSKSCRICRAHSEHLWQHPERADAVATSMAATGTTRVPSSRNDRATAVHHTR